MIKKQQTYLNNIATLFLVTTPIGNLEEVSPRVIATLQEVAVILAEDTRVTQRLLTKFGITTKLTSFHKFNERQKTTFALNHLIAGQNVALLSCAGTPLIADPGHYLVQKVLEHNFNLTSVGINSPLLVGLICSGFFSEDFYFSNFLTNSAFKKRKKILTWKKLTMPVVFYDSVHKLKTTLLLLKELLPERKFFLGREISKRHETFYWGQIGQLEETTFLFKGEFVLVLAPLIT